MRQRLNNESGIALVMAIGILTVLMIAGASVVYYAGSNARSAEYSGDDTKAVNLGEAGMNYARAILWNSSNPTSASALPSCTPSPPQLTMVGGTVTYCGSYDAATKIWTLIGTGNYTNPTGAGTSPISRTVTSQVQVTTSSSIDPAWAYLFADTTSLCTNFKNIMSVDAPLYVRGDLCMENSAVVRSELVRVRGKIQIKNVASVGTVADTVDIVEVGGGCRRPWSGSYVTPCGTSQRVYRETFSSTPPDIVKPAVDLDYWYLNAKPGPKAGCTTGSFPGAFDNSGPSATAPDRSNGTQYLFPTSAYDCTVMSGTTQLGRIAYTPGNPGTFIIDGVVFFDGKIEFQGNRNVVYQGRGTIYASDEIKFQNFITLCGIAGCTPSWDPDVNLLAFVGGSSGDSSILIENNTTLQTALYATNDYFQKNYANVCGPVIAQELKIENGTSNCYVPFSSMAPGMPGSSGPTVATLTNVPNSYTTD